MSILRKLRGDRNTSSSINEGSDGSQNQLGLMHLKKLFNELTHPKEPLSESDRDSKLYNMLPLFCKIFGACHSGEMNEKFWDILAFCQQISRLMVSEIRRRASNQSTEAASIAIVRFLEIENKEESSNGWMLLSALNLLAAGDQSIIQTMTSASVPSTLVKCLYLFFDLPDITDEEENQPNEDCEFTPRERRILLQRIFVQLLVRLCSHSHAAEELARMDDLTLLFLAITSQCPSYNMVWRKSAAEVLTTLSRHGLTDPVVNYIHSKGCIAASMDNLQRSPQLTPLEVVEMFVAIFCFLKDSSEVSQVLLEDFRMCQGYAFISEFLLKLSEEKNPNGETEPALRNCCHMVASLSMCGFQELQPNPNSTGSLFRMQGFQMPQTSSRGTSVRNVHAFQVLQNVFLKSNSPSLCCTILDAISSVYHSDNANYFILESQNTLSQFAEKIHQKNPEIQEKFFELLEFIVFQLNFVPCKELISLSILLKSNHSISCSILCMTTLLNILKHNAIFKDVYREVGILEVFVTCLNRYCSFLEQHNAEVECDVENCEIYKEDPNESLGKLILEALTILMINNNNNSTVFRESGGAKRIHEMVKFTHCRESVLAIIRELILSNGGDDDMLFILTTMHSAPAHKIEFKIQILKSILGCLRDSHRTRVVFRKVGGFVYVTSIFVSLDGKLSDNSDIIMDGEAENQKRIQLSSLLQLLNIVFQTLATSMRFEPANAKFFSQEICSTSLCDTLRLLGCFSNRTVFSDGPQDVKAFENIDCYFQNVFTGSLSQPEFTKDHPLSLSFITLIYRFLYDLVLDNYEKPILSGVLNITFLNQSKPESNKIAKLDPRVAVSSLNLTQPPPEPIIVHPGIVICMLQLLPSVEHDTENIEGQFLQCYLAEVIKSLVRSERNQQIMCEHGLAGHVLKIGKSVLNEEKNLLHVPLQYILERLAAQALKPTELREFLRLGSPLHCENIELGKIFNVGGPVPLTRIKTLVSMTTPRDFRAHGSYTVPPFVEFDMSAEGFGCLYLPSIAPQAPALGNNSSQESGTTIGGIGTGERVFPPQTGMSYSTWFCVDKFSDPRTDPHCIRLLTITRIVNNIREDHVVCLSVLLSARDKAIIVSTQETLLPPNIGEWEPDGSGDNSARIWCPDVLQEGQWHHLLVVLNRAVLKNSTFSLFLDGQHMHTQKLHYISQSPGGTTSSSVNATNSVYAIIGTPPAWRRYSRLCWKQGVCHLLEEVLPAQTVACIFQLGPFYMGSFQAPQVKRHSEPLSSLLQEERVIYGMNAKAMSQLTLARIRKVYSRTDNKFIAKQLGMSSNENATPIRILHNSAGHLAGSARTLGGVVVGYLGVRVFSPNPVSTMMGTVGGCSVLLGIIAMSQDVESLYAGVKALTCVVKSNKAAQVEMDRKRCYQTLGMFFKKKKNLLNSHILHLTFSLVGTVNSGQETSAAIPNVTAFQDLLCDLEIWLNAPNGLLRSLLEHLLELISESAEKRTNIKIMRELQLVSKLLHIISEVNENATKEILFSLLSILLGGQPRLVDLLHFGQFITAKLPNSAENEKSIDLTHLVSNKDFTVIDDAENGSVTIVMRNIVLRNRCLSLLHSLLFTIRNTVNAIICDEISKILGLDWILLFMQPNLHQSTVVWSMRILVVLLANETLITRFRDGIMNGGYLRNTELISQNKNSVVLSHHSQLTAPSPASPSALVSQPGMTIPAQIAGEAKVQGLSINGFQYLEWLLPYHLEVPELYFLLTALIMGQPVKCLATEHTKLDLDRVWAFLWGGSVSPSSANSPKVVLCPEAVCVLLTIVRTIVHSNNEIPWLKNHPVTIIQVIFSLYHNLPDFMPILMLGEVISSLVSILFPPSNEIENESNASTPEESDITQNPILIGSTRYENKLTEHPVRKFVIDLLRVIVIDSLSLAVVGKTPVIDLVIDASPESSELSMQAAFQTEIITALMDHLLAADMLVGEQAALPIVPLLQSHIQNIAPNVFYLTARIVDKLWQGYLNKDAHEIFEFIVKLIGQAKRRTSSISLEQLHHSLNRTILYLLSRPTESVAEQMAVLDTLHKLTTNRLLIFGAGNHELEFIGCLTYCLLQLTADIRIELDTNAKNTLWHVNPRNEMLESRDELLNQHQGRNLIVGAAFRVWEELYVCKKPAIEEVFKISLTSPPANAKAPDLTTTREQVIESAVKLWHIYIDNEKKATRHVPWELHNQIQSKIQKVTGGLTRLASRTKVKKEDGVKNKTTIKKETALEWINLHSGLVRDLWEMRCAQYIHMSQHTQRYVLQEWIQSECELTRERGLWGPTKGSVLDKWMLDTTEGPHRMRKKTMRNELFYQQYPYRAELEHPDNKQLKYKVATCFDAKLYFQCYQTSNHQTRVLCEAETELYQNTGNSESTPVQTPTQQQHEITLNRSQSEPGEEMDEDVEEETSMVPDNQTLLRMLEENEKISHMFRCARIQGLDTSEGLILFGKEHCYVVDGFTLLKNREIRDIDSMSTGTYEPILPASGGPRLQSLRQCSKFAYEDIREVHKRRYLLQPIALEIFSGDGRNYLLSFQRKVRNKVYQRVMALATSIADNAQSSVAGQRRTASVEQTSGLLSSLIGETSVTQRWVRGEISNFQYLMHLNTLAGRSYNDLMQYPVFPWILADYESEDLDLTSPKTFRDFAKPMGAQSTDRLDQFQKRFREWDDPQGETPPYHYGTHYSSAMIVCSYLVRLEPFTQHFLRLQGGHFDLADRMFHSIKEGWLSASKHNMADVKELIPEFFYLPEFLANSNNFDLGSKQNGDTLGDVILPPWAKQDPREFIRVHRQALECDYVSQHLHLWIDLIFGYRQQGPPAVDAVNVFHYLFYEGNVDIYNIEDPLKKNATIGFINNFGQIPKQLFKKPHPSKKMNPLRHSMIDPTPMILSTGTSIPFEKMFFHNLDNLKPSIQPVKELKGPVGQIMHPDKVVLAVEQNKVLMPPTFSRYVSWGFADHSLRIGMYDSDRAMFVCEITSHSGEILACACPNARTIITAGTSSVVTVWELNSRHKMLTVKQQLYGHTDAVTCLAASPAYNIIVSGSRDGTAIIWDMSRYTFVRQLRDHVGIVAAVAINDLTGEIATCSATWLHLWSINGDCLAIVNTSIGSSDRMQQILCVSFSMTREWDSQNVIITGSTDGVVRMWSMDYVQIPNAKPEIAEEAKEENLVEETFEEQKEKKKAELVKQMSLSTDERALAKSGSESSISEACDSVKETRKQYEDEKEECSDKEDQASGKNLLSVDCKTNMSSAKSMTQLKNVGDVVRRRTGDNLRKREAKLKSVSHIEQSLDDSDDFEDIATEKGIRPSKSDTSLTESFVMIDGEGGGGSGGGLRRLSSKQNVLRDGFKWQKQLVFRSKLTMHTAYDRKDNSEPASITALSVSKDHRTLYVGDARGRVFSWSVAEQPGRGMADHWLKDESTDQCVGCHIRFSIYERKHHCRNCGLVFCNKCSRFESEISRLRILKPVRVCQSCYTHLRQSSVDN